MSVSLRNKLKIVNTLTARAAMKPSPAIRAQQSQSCEVSGAHVCGVDDDGGVGTNAPMCEKHVTRFDGADR
jgi:hypothetical protein